MHILKEEEACLFIAHLIYPFFKSSFSLVKTCYINHDQDKLSPKQTPVCCLQYHKEVVRLMSGEFRQRIGERYIAFARKWMNYVLTKCESGRGTKPR